MYYTDDYQLARSIIGFVWAIGYVVALWRMFVKAGIPGWAAIIPIYNAYLVLKLADRRGWWLVLYLIPGVNIVIGIIVAIDIARAFGRGAAFGVILDYFLMPIGYLIHAFDSSTPPRMSRV